MQKQFRSFAQNQNSWITWGFLYFALVIMPVFVIYGQIYGWLSGDLELSLNGESALLEAKGTSIREAFKPESVLSCVVNRLCAKNPEVFINWVKNFDKQIPGAARWIAWDNQDNLIDLPPHLLIPGKRRWQTYLREIRFGQENKGDTSEGRFLQEKWLQPLLGGKINVEDVADSQGRIVSGDFLGKNCLLFWQHANYRHDSSKSAVNGFYLILFVDMLPDNFWSRMAQQGYLPKGMINPEYPIGLWTYNQPEKQMFQKPLSRKKDFGKKLKNALEKCNTSYVIVDDWLGVSVYTSPEKNERVFVFKNIGNKIQSSQYSFEVLNLFTLLLLASGFFLTLIFKRGVGRNVSLQWRITGYFLLGIGLPMFGLFQGMIVIGNYQEERLREEIGTCLRNCSRIHEKILKDFPPVHASKTARKVNHIASSSKSLPEVAEKLNKLIQENWFQNYFLSDPKGKLALTGARRVERPLLAMMKSVLQIEMSVFEAQELERKQTIGNIMLDEVGKEAQVTELGEGDVLSRPGRWNSFRLARTDVLLMKCLVWLEGVPHACILLAKDINLRYFFCLKESNIQRFASKNPAENVEQAFFSKSPGTHCHFPPDSPLFKREELKRLLVEDSEVLLEVTIDSERFIVFSPSRIGSSYRSVFFSSLSRALGKVEERRKQMFVIAVVALAIALLLGVLLANKLLVPIKRMDDALGLVSSGDLDVQLEVESGDEIGQISQTFNNMVEGLREKKRMLPYVSEAVLAAVKDSDATGQKEGEVVEATILFSDIRGFTTLCESYSPREIFAMLNEFLGGVERELSRYGGEVDKFIGDAVMAVFRTSDDEQALSAVCAAFAMKEFLKNLNEKRAEAGLFPINVGIGISTGKVMQGDVGSERRKDLTVIGDEVNLAARLETASKSGKHTQIVISENTWKLVQEKVEVEEMSLTAVKGKHQAVRMFEVVSLKNCKA
ncbi:MAG: HAMP domain-containing protein [Candidatus Riflebacteria bacterium]|nr:HAMP domain-containing protein [Candidatus Riflebacteria bacterium]